MTRRILLAIPFTVMLAGDVMSQTIDYPKIGKEMPHFQFQKYEGPAKGDLNNSALKGRYVILDFWSTGCGACIESMPKMYSLSEKFKDKLDIIMVGMEEKKRSISGLYKVIKEKNRLDLISAYDSIYFKRFVHSTVPYLVWIDPEGIIKAITTNVEATEDNLKKFLSGSPFEFKDVSYTALQNKAPQVDYFKPLLVDGNGGTNPKYLFRSVLYKWQLGMGNGKYTDIDKFLQLYGRNRFQTTRANLFTLYRFAYFGTNDYISSYLNPKVILKCRDTSLFTFNYSGNGIGLYNYSVEIPEELANKVQIMRAMQEDLHKYFGFNVNVVKMETPYLALVVSDPQKTANIMGKMGDEISNWGPELRNVELLNFPVDQLKNLIGLYLPGKNVIYDETNLHGFINLNFPGKHLTNLEALRISLQDFGLDLKPSKKLMKTIVIEDDPEKLN